MTPIEAAARALLAQFNTRRGSPHSWENLHPIRRLEWQMEAHAAVTAYLKAVAEDEATIQRVFEAWKEHPTLGECAKAAILSLIPEPTYD